MAKGLDGPAPPTVRGIVHDGQDRQRGDGDQDRRSCLSAPLHGATLPSLARCEGTGQSGWKPAGGPNAHRDVFAVARCRDARGNGIVDDGGDGLGRYGPWLAAFRDDVSRYESVALALVEPRGDQAGEPLVGFPPEDSRILLRNFFSTLYLRYDERFVYGAPDLKPVTRRRFWTNDAPALVAGGPSGLPRLPVGYEPRTAEPEADLDGPRGL